MQAKFDAKMKWTSRIKLETLGQSERKTVGPMWIRRIPWYDMVIDWYFQHIPSISSLLSSTRLVCMRVLNSWRSVACESKVQL